MMIKQLFGVGVLSIAGLFTYNEVTTHNAKASNDQNVIQLGDVQIEIHSAEAHDKIVDRTGFQSVKPLSDNGEFVVIEATVANNESTQLVLDTQLVYNLVTANGQVFEPTAIQFDDFFGMEAINPGLSVTGKLAFEVPANLKDYELFVESSEANGTVPIP